MSIIALPSNKAPRVFVASKIGCALDGVTDDAPLINLILSLASAANPIKFIIDGVAAVSCLQIAPIGNTTIEGLGWGTGFSHIVTPTSGTPYPYTAAGDAIRIGPPSPSNATSSTSTGDGLGFTSPPSRTASNIVLRDFSLSGPGNYVGLASGVSINSILVSNCTNFLIDHVWVNAMSTSAIKISNCGSYAIRHCQITGGNNGDGIHMNGYCDEFVIDSCVICCADDGIAHNACEGFAGPIQRGTITNCVFGGQVGYGLNSTGWQSAAFRMYTSFNTTQSTQIKDVAVSNCVAWVGGQFCKFGPDPGSNNPTVDAILNVTFDNCVCTLGDGPGSGPNAHGTAYFIVAVDSIGSLNINNCVVNVSTYTNSPINIQGMYNGNIHINGLTISRNADGNILTPAVIEFAPQTKPAPAINTARLFLSRISCDDTVGQTYTAIPCFIQIAGTGGNTTLQQTGISEVIVHEFAPEHFTALCNAYSQITTIAGTGLLGTGWQLPDAQVANNTLYVSATSGVPSIKVAGVPHAL
jgi:hypothetical protein